MSKSKKKGKIIKVIVIVALLLAAVGGVFYAKSAGKSTASNITCISGTVKQQDLAKYVNMSGTVAGKNSVSVTGDPTLKVEKLNVSKGDTVKKGDILCVFDSTSLQDEFDSLSENNSKAQGAQNYTHGINQRNLENARRDKTNALSKAQQDIDDAIEKRDKAYDDYNSKVQRFNDMNKEIDKVYAEMYETDNEDEAKEKEARWKELREQSAVLGTEIDNEHTMLSSFDDAVTAAKRAYEDVEKSANNIIQNAQDTIDQEQYSNIDNQTSEKLKKLSEQIEQCTVIAPMDGIVTSLNITEGMIAGTSNIMTISDASGLIVKGKVNETDILSLSEGMKADITTNATGDEIIGGKVKRIERISSAGDTPDSIGGYNVEISVDDPKKLLIGMSASVNIVLDEKSDALCVPYDSIQTDENDESYVWAATDNGDGTYTISKVLVKTGFEGDYYTEIASNSLKKGDKVITGSYSISEGDIVSLDASEE